MISPLSLIFSNISGHLAASSFMKNTPCLRVKNAIFFIHAYSPIIHENHPFFNTVPVHRLSTKLSTLLKNGKYSVQPEALEKGDAELPTVSILISAYNEEAVIERKIQNILEIDYPKEKLEVLIDFMGNSDIIYTYFCAKK